MSGGWGIEPPVRVYIRSFLSENWLKFQSLGKISTSAPSSFRSIPTLADGIMEKVNPLDGVNKFGNDSFQSYIFRRRTCEQSAIYIRIRQVGSHYKHKQ